MSEPKKDPPADDARDDATAAQVLYDDEPQPGGGALRGRGEQGMDPPGGNAPNAPIDLGVDGGSGASAEEAKGQSAEDAG